MKQSFVHTPGELLQAADSVEKPVVEAAVVVAILSMRASCSGVAGFFVF